MNLLNSAVLNCLRTRARQPEIMDQPDLDPSAFLGALQALERINWLSGSAGILWPPIAELARTEARRPLRVLDIACGAGDVPIRLWQRARATGVMLQMEACDRNETALAYASRQAAANGVPLRLFRWDAETGQMAGTYDIVTCSLFLHHLDYAGGLRLLEIMARASQRLLLVNDLVRGRLGYALAVLGTRLLARSPVARVDGPRSVESAYSIAEVRELACRAGLACATVKRRWPCRFLLRWNNPGSVANG
jgi:2-polyprenyl-3-methyl-5-hydroxy-6-metoxy-1,4-benzoquinol methylase